MSLQNCEKRLLAPSCLSVCLAVRLSVWINSAATGRIFIKFDIWVFFENLFRKRGVSLKCDKNNGLFCLKITIHLLSHLASFSLEWKMLQTKVEEKIKTHISYKITFFEIRDVCERIWKNIVEIGRSQLTIWLMRITCKITKATNTQSEYIYFPLQLSYCYVLHALPFMFSF
jgi:hypothetical protein